MDFKTITNQKGHDTFFIDGKRTSREKFEFNRVLESIKGKKENSILLKTIKGKKYFSFSMD